MAQLIDMFKKHKYCDIVYTSVKKLEIKWLKFWLSQKVEIYLK